MHSLCRISFSLPLLSLHVPSEYWWSSRTDKSFEATRFCVPFHRDTHFDVNISLVHLGQNLSFKSLSVLRRLDLVLSVLGSTHKTVPGIFYSFSLDAKVSHCLKRHKHAHLHSSCVRRRFIESIRYPGLPISLLSYFFCSEITET